METPTYAEINNANARRTAHALNALHECIDRPKLWEEVLEKHNNDLSSYLNDPDAFRRHPGLEVYAQRTLDRAGALTRNDQNALNAMRSRRALLRIGVEFIPPTGCPVKRYRSKKTLFGIATNFVRTDPTRGQKKDFKLLGAHCESLGAIVRYELDDKNPRRDRLIVSDGETEGSISRGDFQKIPRRHMRKQVAKV